MTKAEEFKHLPQDGRQESDYVVCKWMIENRGLMIEALAFFERKEAIRAAIAGLEGTSSNPHHPFWNEAIGAALAAFDREAK